MPALLVALIAVGCAASTPAPARVLATPRAIVVSTAEGGSPSAFKPGVPMVSPSERIWVGVIPRYFAETGYYADGLDKHIAASLKVLIDGSVVPSENLQITSSHMLGGALYDMNGKQVGGYSASLEIYISTGNLKPGTHTVFVSASKPSGEILSASWQFVIGS